MAAAPPSEPDWSTFYGALRRLAPRMLRRVPRDMADWISEASVDSDRFWSESFEEVLRSYWRDSPEKAVTRVLARWLEQVRIVTDESLEFFSDDRAWVRRRRAAIPGITLAPQADLVAQLVAAACGVPLPESEEEAEPELAADDDLASTPPPAEPDVPEERLAFELLPDEGWDLAGLLDRARTGASAARGAGIEPVVDPQRLAAIRSLRPQRCYVGTAGWSGYVLFEFPLLGKSILECPVEGHATYVLSGDWRPMVRSTRQRLREAFPGRYVKVVHKDGWLDRVRAALHAAS